MLSIKEIFKEFRIFNRKMKNGNNKSKIVEDKQKWLKTSNQSSFSVNHDDSASASLEAQPCCSSRIKFKFVKKLYQMLSNPGINHIIKWGNDGSFFLISNCELFVEHVMYSYFKHKCFSNFVRQLNMYSFKKIRSEKSACCYKHQYFLRDDPGLATKIVRKATSQQKPSSLSYASERKVEIEIKLSIESLEKRIIQESIKTDDLKEKNIKFKLELEKNLNYISYLELVIAQLIGLLIKRETGAEPERSEILSQMKATNSELFSHNLVHKLTNINNWKEESHSLALDKDRNDIPEQSRIISNQPIKVFKPIEIVSSNNLGRSENGNFKLLELHSNRKNSFDPDH